MDYDELLNEMVDKGLADRKPPNIVIDHNRGKLDMFECVEFTAGSDESNYRRN